jgi:tetratricopeptide (TPR) repeat protein
MRDGDRKRRFGEALVQAGVMDRDEVGRSVAKQVKRICVSLFGISEGVSTFEERPSSIPLEYMVSVSLHRLLYAGIKQMEGEALVLKGLEPLDRWVTLAALPPFRFGVRKCSAEELEILEQAHKRVTLRRLAWTKGGLELSRARSVYALLASGILEEADRPEGQRQPVIQMETGTFLLSALRKQPEISHPEALRREVDDELQRSARLDRQAWLKVSETAPREVLLKAIEDKMDRYHALLEAVAEDEGLKTDIELILGRALSMLRLVKQAPAPARPARPAAAATSAPAPVAIPPLILPGNVTPVPPPPVTPVPALVTPVPAAVASTATPAARVAPAAASGPEHVEPGAQALEHLLMEAQLRMTVGDYAAAVESYTKIVQRFPNEPGPRMRLAVAMACYPRTAKAAEREFLEAARLAPDNADLHYQFGLYYKAMKVRSRAIAEFRTALTLNPGHKLARTELEALSPKDSALTSLKKFFR